MDFNTVLIFLSLSVIISYLYDMFATWSKIPSVLLLVGTGIIIAQLSNYFGFEIPITEQFLLLMGQLGLILIVLEGALDLKITKEKIPLIRRAFLSALLVLFITTGAISAILVVMLSVEWDKAFVNAIPLGVVSSAITIPSVSKLAKVKKEFFVYESTFSDILGIMLFNFVTGSQGIGVQSIASFSLSLVSVLLISVVCSVVLIILIDRIKLHIKFFLIIAVLVMLYSIGKIFHLSSLLLILAFGLLINNYLLLEKQINRVYSIKFRNTPFELTQMKLITGELAFVIRTFFFVMFGLSIPIELLYEYRTLYIGSLIIIVILLMRYAYLRFIAKTDIIPELFVAPRGLITIVLFYSIVQQAPQYVIEGLSEGILMFVIIVSSLIMMVGLMVTKTNIDQNPHPHIK